MCGLPSDSSLRYLWVSRCSPWSAFAIDNGSYCRRSSGQSGLAEAEACVLVKLSLLRSMPLCEACEETLQGCSDSCLSHLFWWDDWMFLASSKRCSWLGSCVPSLAACKWWSVRAFSLTIHCLQLKQYGNARKFQVWSALTLTSFAHRTWWEALPWLSLRRRNLI